MINFFGAILDGLKAGTGNYLYALLVYALLSKVLFYMVSRNYHRSVTLKYYLQEQIASLEKKHKNNEKAKNEEISALLLRNRYGLLGSFFLFVTEALIAGLMGLALRDPLIHTSAASISEFTVFGIMLDKAPAAAIMSTEYYVTGFSSIFPIMAVLIMQVWHDTMMQRDRVLDQKKVDMLVWVLQLLLCALLPAGVSIIMLVYKVIDLILYYWFAARKFQKVEKVETSK